MLSRENLYAYQERLAQHIIDNPMCGVFAGMGSGKTAIVLTAIKTLMFQELCVEKVLVIGTKRITESVWHAEASQWSHTSDLTLSRIIGTPKERARALNQDADIHVISRDNLAWLYAQIRSDSWPWDMLVIDESSSFNNDNQRFKIIKQAVDSFNRIVLLTGTPTPNGYQGLYNPMWLLDRGARLGLTKGKYIDNYFKRIPYRGTQYSKIRITEVGQKIIPTLISDICKSLNPEDYLELPPRQEHVVNVKLPEKVREQYLSFEEEKILELPEGEVDVMSASALSSKLLQFAGGAVYDSDKKVHKVHNEKLEILNDLVEEAQSNVIIVYAFIHEKVRILEKLKRFDPVSDLTEQNIKKWNQGKIRVMVTHPASAAHGLNLQFGGNVIIWYGLTWNLEYYLQMNDRVRRIGQKAAFVSQYYLIAEGTLDSDQLEALQGKKGEQEALMDAVRLRIAKVVNRLKGKK